MDAYAQTKGDLAAAQLPNLPPQLQKTSGTLSMRTWGKSRDGSIAGDALPLHIDSEMGWLSGHNQLTPIGVDPSSTLDRDHAYRRLRSCRVRTRRRHQQRKKV